VRENDTKRSYHGCQKTSNDGSSGRGPPAVSPQLPHSADPGTITGWILDETVAKTPTRVTQDLERGFNRLVTNIPIPTHADYGATMRKMTDEVISSDTLMTYLTATNRWNGVVRITVVYSIACYSSGFGGSNALHGQILALLGEIVGNQLPILVKLVDDPSEDLAHGFAMEDICMPSDALVDAYFAGPAALDLMPGTTVALDGTDMNLSNLCPIPIAWAPYFLILKLRTRPSKWEECFWGRFQAWRTAIVRRHYWIGYKQRASVWALTPPTVFVAYWIKVLSLQLRTQG
jgi:hypothetical protein